MRLFHLLACLLILPHAAAAQEQSLSGKIAVELNTLQNVEGDCVMTFMVTNGTETAIDKLVFEAVLFDRAGQVERLTLFDFGSLPAKRPRVRQFSVPSLDCATLGRVLFNGASACEGEGLDPATCDAALAPTSRVDVEVIG